MTTFTLKLIAMLSMLTDHISYIFTWDITPLNYIGRLAFPLYAFMIAEAFRHTKDNRDRLNAHIKSYLILALISELPFDCVYFASFRPDEFMCAQNDILGFLIAYLGLWAIDSWKEKPLYLWAAVLGTSFISMGLNIDYHILATLTVYGFYWYLTHYLDKPFYKRLLVLLGIILAFDILNILVTVQPFSIELFNTYIIDCSGITLGIACLFSAPILAFYRGKKGYSSKAFNTVFKWFYPAHLTIIAIVMFIWSLS